MSDETEAKVVDFVAEFRAVPADELTMETTLFGDLHIDGDDGFELIEAFANTFDVDMGLFRVRDYFGPEGAPADPISLIVLFIRDLLRRGEPTPEGRAGLILIRIAGLVAAAREKKWPETKRA